VVLDDIHTLPSTNTRTLAQPSAAITSQPVELTDFQRLVEASLGKPLPVYGENLFENVPTTFAPIDRVPVTSDYVIGPGDELLIRAWGQIDLDIHARVDRNGAIYLPKVGNLNVAGLKYDQVQQFLKAHIGRIYQNFDLNVTLGELRSIDVFVVGQARRPGRYTVSSLSTLANAVFSSGGPSPSGSMRHIELKRGKNMVTDFDLYDLLLKGDKSKDVLLLPEDVIYISPIGPQVALGGRSMCRPSTNSKPRLAWEKFCNLRAAFRRLPTGPRYISKRSRIGRTAASRKSSWIRPGWPIL